MHLWTFRVRLRYFKKINIAQLRGAWRESYQEELQCKTWHVQFRKGCSWDPNLWHRREQDFDNTLTDEDICSPAADFYRSCFWHDGVWSRGTPFTCACIINLGVPWKRSDCTFQFHTFLIFYPLSCNFRSLNWVIISQYYSERCAWAMQSVVKNRTCSSCVLRRHKKLQ
jgi:hypothetical protein